MITLAEFAPKCTFVAPRLMEEMHPGSPFAGREAEALTGALLAVCGPLPILAHTAASSPRLLDAIMASGLPMPTAIDRFDSREGYVVRVRERMAAGESAWFTSPLPADLFADTPTLVLPSLLSELNLRDAIDRLVPPENRPRRRIIEGRADVAQALAGLRPGPVVKDANLPSSAGGAGVWVLRHKRHVARARAGLNCSERIVIEERIAYTANHCVQCAVTAGQEVVFLGASMQRTTASGTYLGNRLDPATPPSPEARALALKITTAAAQLGYRGIAGFDILERPEGPPVAIDLNFRPNASTPFLLAFQSLGPPRGFPAAELVFARTSLAAPALLARLGPMIQAGWLAILGLFDPLEAGLPTAPTTVRLLVMAGDTREFASRRKALRGAGLLLGDERPSPMHRIMCGFRKLLA